MVRNGRGKATFFGSGDVCDAFFRWSVEWPVCGNLIWSGPQARNVVDLAEGPVNRRAAFTPLHRPNCEWLPCP